MLLKVHSKFLKNCGWKIAYILSGENGYYDLRKKPIRVKKRTTISDRRGFKT